ncbi:tRNA synthetases class I (M)-domain-containing protein [Powellomyces hirtus]|nr:tRNA synthetases class I (M)-domain-containing protein [Powellomyces hirtus]
MYSLARHLRRSPCPYSVSRVLLGVVPSHTTRRSHSESILRPSATSRTAQTDRPLYITTPIFYVNADPHIGHLYSAVLADTLKRWYDLQGYSTVFSTGTDEHGQKIQEAALKNNMEPGAFCDRVSENFKRLFKEANISYTDYIRTTEPRHKRTVWSLWETLKNAGYIYKGSHEGWYAVSDETFYPLSQVEERLDQNGNAAGMFSKETGQPVVWTKEENYKFRLSAFQSRLVAWLEANPNAIVPRAQYNEVMLALTTRASEQLSDLSISRLRRRVEWGIPVPDDPDHVIYVWLDALANYLTVLGYPWSTPKGSSLPSTASHDAAIAQLQDAWPAQWHIVGKDILKFHAIYWPAFLMAAGLPPPRRILSHAHWLRKREKMSKSKGNVVDPTDLITRYGPDPVRYFLMRDGGIANDSEFSFDTLHQRYKKDLGGQLGNLVMRCSAPKINPTMTAPVTPGVTSAADDELHRKLEGLADTVKHHFDAADFPRGLEAIFDLVAATNRYWVSSEPWKLVKDPRPLAAEQLHTVLFYAFESIRVAAILLLPILPQKMAALLDAIGVPPEERLFINARVGQRSLVRKEDVSIAVHQPPFPSLE